MPAWQLLLDVQGLQRVPIHGAVKSRRRHQSKMGGCCSGHNISDSSCSSSSSRSSRRRRKRTAIMMLLQQLTVLKRAQAHVEGVVEVQAGAEAEAGEEVAGVAGVQAALAGPPAST